MANFRGGGGSTNIRYVAPRTARQKAAIQTYAARGCLPCRRGEGSAAFGESLGGTTDPLRVDPPGAGRAADRAAPAGSLSGSSFTNRRVAGPASRSNRRPATIGSRGNGEPNGGRHQPQDPDSVPRSSSSYS